MSKVRRARGTIAEMSATACRSTCVGEDGFGILGSLSGLELKRMSSGRLLGKGGGIRPSSVGRLIPFE